MVDLEAPFPEHFLKVSMAERIAQIQATACAMSHASKCLPLKSSFDWRVSFSAMAFRITGSLYNIGSGNFLTHGQRRVKHKNL